MKFRCDASTHSNEPLSRSTLSCLSTKPSREMRNLFLAILVRVLFLSDVLKQICNEVIIGTPGASQLMECVNSGSRENGIFGSLYRGD